jgi:putative acetyltransferase
MILRPEQPTDQSAIHAVHTAAFRGGRVGEVAEAVLWDLLLAAGDTIAELCFVCEVDTEVVAHAGVSRADVAGRPVVTLGPIGVLPAHQGLGFGSALVRNLLAAAEARAEPAVLLLGDPAFYARFGFELTEPYGIDPPVPEWRPAFQLCRLPAWDGTLRGDFHYAPAFSIV